MTISAKVLNKVSNGYGDVFVQFEIVAHRFILAEFNTHRLVSRNWRSSRAVPVKKLIKELREAPAYPVEWRAEQSGMTSGDFLDKKTAAACRDQWRVAANYAANQVEILMGLGLHKSWSNRIIEPYLYVHGVCGATEYTNFYEQRLAIDAQPEIRVLAEKMQAASDAAPTVNLVHGQWVLPYINTQDINPNIENFDQINFNNIKASVARVARVSYKPHDAETADAEKDIKLCDKLFIDNHLSPFEQIVTPDFKIAGQWVHPHFHGNLNGFIQFRKVVEYCKFGLNSLRPTLQTLMSKV